MTSEKKTEKSDSFQAVKGMHDVLPAEELYRERVEAVMKSLAPVL